MVKPPDELDDEPDEELPELLDPLPVDPDDTDEEEPLFVEELLLPDEVFLLDVLLPDPLDVVVVGAGFSLTVTASSFSTLLPLGSAMIYLTV